MKYLPTILCCYLFLTSAAYGDVIWVRGTNQPISGQVITQTDEKIEFKVFSDGKFGPIKSFPISQVETVVVNYDQERLASLSPDNPVAYRNYAEELSTQRSDPAAINLARRLYLLAAANSTKKSQHDLRSGAILALISLTTEQKQRRHLEMFYRLSEPESGKLKPAASSPPPKLPTKADRELMLRVVVAIRRENSEVAMGLIRSEENRKSFEKWEQLCTLEELTRIAAADYPSRSQLGRLLAVELAARQPETAKLDPGSKKMTWGELAMEPGTEFSVLPTIANVTQFDPEKSVYRNGIWVGL